MFGIDDIGAAIGGIAGAGASIFGSAAQNAANKQNAQDQFFYNLMLQQQAQAFNAEMANTQYQRTTADMRAAGLNPILAAGGFSPDSASGGGQSSVSQARSENVMGNVASSASTLGKMLAELKQIDQHVEESKAKEGEAKGRTLAPGLASQASAAGAQRDLASAAASGASVGKQKAETKLTEVQTEKEKILKGLMEKYGVSGSLTDPRTIETIFHRLQKEGVFDHQSRGQRAVSKMLQPSSAKEAATFTDHKNAYGAMGIRGRVIPYRENKRSNRAE